MNNLLEGVAGGSSGGGGGGYDWNDETNKSKWRGVLTEGLSKLLRHQQQSGTSGYPSDTLSATSTLLGGGGGLTADHGPTTRLWTTSRDSLSTYLSSLQRDPCR